jgi:hypothetical protein
VSAQLVSLFAGHKSGTLSQFHLETKELLFRFTQHPLMSVYTIQLFGQIVLATGDTHAVAFDFEAEEVCYTKNSQISVPTYASLINPIYEDEMGLDIQSKSKISETSLNGNFSKTKRNCEPLEDIKKLTQSNQEEFKGDHQITNSINLTKTSQKKLEPIHESKIKEEFKDFSNSQDSETSEDSETSQNFEESSDSNL